MKFRSLAMMIAACVAMATPAIFADSPCGCGQVASPRCGLFGRSVSAPCGGCGGGWVNNGCGGVAGGSVVGGGSGCGSC
ncbi:MAG: hypothetical protein ACK6CE_05285, partial [Planctomycetota bacterium]